MVNSPRLFAEGYSDRQRETHKGTEHLAINNTRTRRLLIRLALRTTAKLYKRRRDPRFRPFKTTQEFHHWLREGFDTADHSDKPGTSPKPTGRT